MKISKGSLRMSASPLHGFFRKVARMRAEGRDVISLGVGEPDGDTPAVIRQVGIRAIEEGLTGYVPSVGSMELRAVIAEKYGARPEEVVVSTGSKILLTSILMCLLDPGDRMFIPAPYYPSYFEAANLIGAWTILLDTRDDGFKLKPEMVRKFIPVFGFGPSVLIINSPNNPTGAEYERSDLEEIVRISRQHGLVVISDECYSNFSRDQNFSLRQFDPGVIVVNSASKTYAMAGWRIGWAVLPENLAVQVGKFLENLVGCPSPFAEKALIEALRGRNIPDYSRQRKMVSDWMSGIGITGAPSEGGFYAFADFSPYLGARSFNDAFGLAEYLLEKGGVAVTPGVAFGEEFRNFIRIAFPIEIERLEEALGRMKSALGGIG